MGEAQRAVSGPHYDITPGYEPEIVAVYEHFVRPGDLVVDVGASLGHHTVALAGLVGPEGLVLAFEPNGESYEHLERNIAMRGLENVKAYQLALWGEEAYLRLYSVADLGYTSICHYAGTRYTETVEARSLDVVLGGQRPRFIKVDCEMSEFEVLKGAEFTLRDGVDAVVVEFNYHLIRQTEIADRKIRDYMARLGYEMFLISIKDPENPTSGFYPPILVPPETEIKMEGETQHINVLFSTVNKVRKVWKTCDISRQSKPSSESLTQSVLILTDARAE